MPVRVRRFRSGVCVVQGRERTDEKTVRGILEWLEGLRVAGSPAEAEPGVLQGVKDGGVSWDWATFGCGVTALEAAERFDWSVGVAAEELEMAEERGAVCREVSSEGVRFWVNHFVGGGGSGG